MAIPSFQQLMLPILQTLARRHEEIAIATLENEVFKALKLPAEERTRMLPSGNIEVDRLWGPQGPGF